MPVENLITNIEFEQRFILINRHPDLQFKIFSTDFEAKDSVQDENFFLPINLRLAFFIRKERLSLIHFQAVIMT